MRIISLILYGLILGIGTYFIVSRGKDNEPEAITTAPLPFNHLIIEKDLLEPPSLPWEAAPASTISVPATSKSATPAVKEPVAADTKEKSPLPSAGKADASSAAKGKTPDETGLREPKKLARFVGKYTHGLVGQGQFLHERELFSTPSLSASGANIHVLLPVKVDDVAQGKINAGSGLCVGRPAAVTVTTVICAPAIAAPCNAVIELPPAEAANLSEEIVSGRRSAAPASSDNKCN
jgi:hypothetical protein